MDGGDGGTERAAEMDEGIMGARLNGDILRCAFADSPESNFVCRVRPLKRTEEIGREGEGLKGARIKYFRAFRFRVEARPKNGFNSRLRATTRGPSAILRGASRLHLMDSS